MRGCGWVGSCYVSMPHVLWAVVGWFRCRRKDSVTVAGLRYTGRVHRTLSHGAGMWYASTSLTVCVVLDVLGGRSMV